MILQFFSRQKCRDPSLSREPKTTTPSVMPSIQPRPNLHAQQHNLDTLERLVFEDFNGSLYASKSTIVISAWDSICCNCSLIRRKFRFIDPRGYINITWLFIQVSLMKSLGSYPSLPNKRMKPLT